MKRPAADPIRHLALAAAAALLVACGGGASLDAPPVRATIGATGGSITSPDGRLTLTVPAGALATPTEIMISEPVATQPAAVKSLGAEKVYRFEPEGLALAVPAGVRLRLAASPQGQVPLLLLHSRGRWEAAAAQTLAVTAEERTLTGQLNHFSELAVKPLDLTHRFDAEPLTLEVGQTLTARYTIVKGAEHGVVDVVESFDPGAFHISTVQMKYVPESQTSGNRSLTAFVADSFSRQSVYQCLEPHSGAVSLSVELHFADNLLAAVLFAEAFITVQQSKDYVCKAPPPNPEELLRTGLFALPLGMTAPDGVGVFQGPFANLPGGTHHALIGGANGALAVDLKTGAVTLDMTTNSAEGRLGNDALLGVAPVSAPGPGASTPAALFGTSAIGGAVRGYTLPQQSSFFRWGATLLTRTQVFDAATAGGAIAADEVMTTVPGTGLNFYRRDSDRWLQTLEQVRAFRFPGSLRSAVLPEPTLGRPLLALTAGSSGGNAVWMHTRDVNADAVRLFDIAGSSARLLRCSRSGLLPGLGNRVLCGATEAGGTVSLFRYDPATPAATPQVQTAQVGAGPVGIQFGRRSNGRPWALTANFDAGTINVLDFDETGTLVGNTAVPVPAACLKPAHAAPVSSGGRDYIVATCNGSGHYLVQEN